jgi:hypothetical protein
LRDYSQSASPQLLPASARGDFFVLVFAMSMFGAKGVQHHLSEFDLRHSNRSALGNKDRERRTLAIKGATDRRLTDRGVAEPDFERLNRRFLSWRKKRCPKSKWA